MLSNTPRGILMTSSNAHILALDQGTTSSRAIVFDSHGGIVGVGRQPFQQHYLRPGWVEHDPDEIWSSQLAAMEPALKCDDISQCDISTVGLTNQRELMDDFAGEVLDALDRPGLRENTIVIWTSDHGEQIGEHGLLTKFVTREASVRVPLMISVPGKAAADVHALVEHVDLFPTVCELVGVDVPDSVQGRSLTPLLDGRVPPDWRTAVFSEIHQFGDSPHIRMIRTADWKLNTYDGEPGVENLRSFERL